MSEITKFNDLKVSYIQPKIEYDLTELENEIGIIESKYSKLIITEEDIPKIKEELAKLNKLKTSINRKRIDTTKEIKVPITEFDDKVKGFEKTIKAVVDNLKKQVDVFADKVKEDKRRAIMVLERYNGIFDERWLNANVSIKSIKSDIEKQRQAYENNTLMIQTTCFAVGLDVDKYIQMLNENREMASIIQAINNDKAVKEQYQERESKPIIKISKEEQTDQDKYTFTLKITGTRIQLKILKDFLKENELKYEKIE